VAHVAVEDGVTQATQNQTTLDVRGVPLVTREAGSGPPLLYLHDELSTAWSPYLDALAATHHVVAPELPGFGDTARPDWAESVDDLAFFVADIVDAVDAVGGGAPIAVVGASLGGWLALEAALRGARISRLVALGSPGAYIAGDPPTDYFFLTPEERVGLFFNDASVAPQVEPAHIVRNEAMTARLVWQPRYVSPKLLGRIHRLDVPTLVVWGDDDRFLSLAHGQALADGAANARLSTITGAGHFPALDKPAETAKLTLDFFGGGQA
jgi:pimeloyl-ACP methyl ester carboxylesterase